MGLTNHFRLFYPDDGQEDYSAQFKETVQTIDRLLKSALGEEMENVPDPGVLFLTLDEFGRISHARQATMADLHPTRAAKSVTRAGKVTIDAYGHITEVEEGVDYGPALQALAEQIAILTARLDNIGGGGPGSGGEGSGGNADFPVTMNVTIPDRFAADPFATTATATGNSTKGAIVSWEWKVASTVVATVQNPTFSFPGPGTHLVTVKATDSAGNTATASTTVVVAAPAVSTTVRIPMGTVARNSYLGPDSGPNDYPNGAHYVPAGNTTRLVSAYTYYYESMDDGEGNPTGVNVADGYHHDTGTWAFSLPAGAQVTDAHFEGVIDSLGHSFVYVQDLSPLNVKVNGGAVQVFQTGLPASFIRQNNSYGASVIGPWNTDAIALGAGVLSGTVEAEWRGAHGARQHTMNADGMRVGVAYRGVELVITYRV